MSNVISVIPFPRTAPASKPQPKALPHPDSIRTVREKQEAADVAWEMARDDINGSGLEGNTRTVLLILAHHGCEQGWRNTGPLPVAELNTVRDTKLTRGEIGAALRQIRGATFAGLGLDWRPYQFFALWVWEFIEQGEDPWRPQRRRQR